MGTHKVRVVVTTKFGCQERTEWHPEGSQAAIDAMCALIDRQTEMFSLSCEHWDDDAESAEAGK